MTEQVRPATALPSAAQSPALSPVYRILSTALVPPAVSLKPPATTPRPALTEAGIEYYVTGIPRNSSEPGPARPEKVGHEGQRGKPALSSFQL